MDLKEERNILFDENFNVKEKDKDRIVKFCRELTNITGVQVCTQFGQLYEYLPEVYKSVVTFNA